jgi:hypothetical protein
MVFHGLLVDSVTLLYADDVRTSQKSHLRALRPVMWIALFLNVHDIRTSEDIYLWSSTAC